MKETQGCQTMVAVRLGWRRDGLRRCVPAAASTDYTAQKKNQLDVAVHVLFMLEQSCMNLSC